MNLKSKTRLLAAFAVLLMLPSAISAQILKGHIYDAKTNEPLAGAVVSYKLKGGNKTVSDINGAYQLKVPEGGVDLVFSYIGYEDVLMPIVIEQREVLEKDVYMKEATKMMQEVVVSAGRFEQKLSDVTMSMSVLKAGDVARQAPTDITSTLKTIPGIDVVDKQPSIRGGGGWTYGVGSRSQVLIDGLSTLNPQSGEINWNSVPLENIEQVEVIKGASSVLYGSSALNGIINIRTARPGLVPKTTVSSYVGIYDQYENPDYKWADNSFWKDGKYPVTPILRNSLYSGIRTPIYEGFDLSHSRRIGNFDVSGGMNIYTDEGYRQQGFNKRLRLGGNVTYHQPDMDGKYLNYGLNFDFLSNKFADFLVWRSPKEPLRPSPYTNMAREDNNISVAPFLNFTDPERGITHKVKARFYYGNNDIYKPMPSPNITDILGNMGTDAGKIADLVQGKGVADLVLPFVQPILQGDFYGAVNGAFTGLEKIFPNATTADYNDLIAWFMAHGLPKEAFTALGGAIGQTSPELGNIVSGMGNGKPGVAEWAAGIANPDRLATPTRMDKNYDYYVDYQLGKRFKGGAQLTAGFTYEHVLYNSAVMNEIHNSDNAALYLQYDQRFWDRLSVSAGVRTEYYRVDDLYREAETKVLGVKVPFRPVLRGGLNYQFGQYSFLRASFGQGYRYPSLTEKMLLKDIGGVSLYPNHDLKPEKGINAELGIKQGYKWGNLRGVADIAGFFTQYDDMIEFYIGLFNTNNYQHINSTSAAIAALAAGNIGLGAQFNNVTKAQIYGLEFSTTGEYEFNKVTKLVYNLGYTYTEPRDANYKERNAIENAYTDPLEMKQKSNNSPYLKYRSRHSFKGTLDFQWKRINIGANFDWHSKIEAADYFFLDERQKAQPDVMDYIRNIVMGNVGGENLASYWRKHNTDVFTMDFRVGVKATKWAAFQLMVNNLLNKEYSYRPMSLNAPRTFVVKLDVTL